MKRFVLLWLVVMGFGISLARAGKHKTAVATSGRGTSSYYAMRSIPRLFYVGETDSLSSLVNAWQKQCPNSEPTVSFVILNEILHKTFYNESDANFFIPAHDVYLYRQQVAAYKTVYLYGSDMGALALVGDSADSINAASKLYYIFLQSLAQSMLIKPGLTPLEQSLVQYYADPLCVDTSRLWALMQSAHARGGKGFHNQGGLGFRQEDKHGSGQELGITTGVWQPTGQLSPAGPRPFVGLTLGFEFNRLFLCLDGNVRIAASHPFPLKYNDTVFSATCAGGYFGLDWRYDLNLLQKNELDLVGGVAIDGAGVSLDDSRTIDFASPNINIGLGYKMLFYHKARKRAIGSNKMYLLLEGKYNYMNYQSQGFPGISGNALTLSLSVRFLYQWWLAGERPL